MNEVKIPIFIADEEAKKFILFQQYYEKFCLLVESGAFSVKNGSVALHFDKNGDLLTIQRADVLYSKRYSLPNT